MPSNRNIIICLMILFAAYTFASCTPTNPCDPNPCLNGGTCAVVDNTAECTCINDYSGATCEIPPCVPDCAGKECGDDGCGGTCGDCTGDQICSAEGMCENIDLPVIKTGSILSPVGCEAYIAPHPITLDTLACCSYNATPKCTTEDVPDIPCYLELEFCDDGTMAKTWDPYPDPDQSLPGHTTGTGVWSYSGSELTLDTNDGMSITTERYSMAFTYSDGVDTFLVLSNPTQNIPNGTVLAGDYSFNSLTDVIVMSEILTMSVNVTKDITVDTGVLPYSWNGTLTTITNCTSTIDMCPGGVPSIVDETVTETYSGTIAPPGELIDVYGDYVLPVFGFPCDKVFVKTP